MNIIFMRHGEATDNVKALISDKEIYWSILTKEGEKKVIDTVAGIDKVDKIYVSPFPRTIQTAHYIFEKNLKAEVIIEDRIREINSGKYSHKKNNEEQDIVRKKQIEGDYFIRFGEYGENKYSIEKRLCEFLKDVYKNNFKNNTIAIVSHGSIISYLKRILKLKSPHIKTGKMEEFKNVDFDIALKHYKNLNKIKNKNIKFKKELITKLNVNSKLKNNLSKILNKEFNNIEFTDEVINNYLEGLSSDKLRVVKNSSFSNGIILICFYNNFENLAEKWIEHYIKIGINNFVLVDNNSTDNSTNILKKYIENVNISFWKIEENYNCYKMCGWKQQILEYYGENKYYLTVDSDELFIYKNYYNISLLDYCKKEKLTYIKALMLDTYANKKIYTGNLDEFKYVDSNTYKTSNKVSYGVRFFGGPRSRMFGINPSLQKIPLIKYTGKEIYINDHFYYPWKINEQARFCSYLLHYKFLPGDDKKYKIYNKEENKNINFYNEKHSILIKDIKF